MGVSTGGLDLENTAVHGQRGNVEGSSSKIEYDHVALVRGVLSSVLVLGVQAICKGGGSGLVDDALDIKSSDAAGILGGLPLLVVEVSRDGDHGLVDGDSHVLLGGHLELAEDKGGDLLGGKLLLGSAPLDLNLGVVVVVNDGEGERLRLLHNNGVVVRTPNDALHIINGVVRVGSNLRLGRVPNNLSLLGEGNPRRHGAPVGSGNHLDLLLGGVPHGNAREGGAQINSNDWLIFRFLVGKVGHY